MKLGENSMLPEKSDNELSEEVKKYMSSLGKKGGKAKGDCKKRNKDDQDYYKKIKKPVLRICEICSAEFVTNVPNQKTCSEKCSREKRLAYQREVQRKRYREMHPIVQRVRKKLDPDTK